MTALQVFQIASAVSYLSLAFFLAICPYRGEEYKSYHRVRKLLMAAMSIFALQFVVQLFFGFRANGAVQGTACNMIFITISAQLVTMALFHLIRYNDSCKREWLWSIGICSFNTLLIIFFAFAFDGEHLKHANHMSFLIFAFVNIYYVYPLNKESQRLKDRIQDYSSIPVEQYMHWVRLYVFARLALCVLLPISLAYNYSTVLLCFAYYLTFVYFIGKFMYFGSFVKSVEDVAEQIKEASTDDTPMSEPQIDYRETEKVLTQWKKQHKFCEPGLTLAGISQNTHISSRVLSQYINYKLHTNFRNWLNDLRVEYSQTLMSSDLNLSIEQIAEMCGFSSRNYYDSVFKERIGITPSVYHRRLMHSNISSGLAAMGNEI